MPRKITPASSLDLFRKDAKRWLKGLRAGEPDARTRLAAVWPDAPREPTLRDVQHALAREYGHESWVAMKEAIQASGAGDGTRQRLSVDGYAQLTRDFLLACNARDEAALGRLNAHYGRSFTHEDLAAEIWRRDYAFRQRSSRVAVNQLPLDEAQTLVAQDVGFGSWSALVQAVATGAPPVPPFVVDPVEHRISPMRQLSRDEWDRVIAVMKERGITAIDAGGLMTDDVLARLATLNHVTSLSLGGSRQLTDAGLMHLARMPQLEHLDLNEYPGGRLTDRGLEVLRHLPNLRRFEMTWQRGITDAGVAHLTHCDRLEQVNLMGSPTGDGAIRALAGKAHLRRLSTGRLVTDAGLQRLRALPRMTRWEGGADGPSRPEDGAFLLIDGPFTDRGLAGLAGLEGVIDLDLFWHVTGLTSGGFVSLRDMPNLASLGADGRLSDDIAMGHIAAIPRLRKLRAQECVATDAGFEALSRSTTLSGFWGRVCPNFGSRGFVAFSRMPALQQLGIGCATVDDRALSSLPDFPALRELTPIGFTDLGFRHIGRCDRLERLTCMYCRETGDAATAHIADLRLRYYYAGLTQITDRSLEILGRMASLEQVELYECRVVTDAGLPFLAALPALREVALDGLPGVTLEGTRVFPARVRVKYST